VQCEMSVQRACAGPRVWVVDSAADGSPAHIMEDRGNTDTATPAGNRRRALRCDTTMGSND
jgi:hypothetical protein